MCGISVLYGHVLLVSDQVCTSVLACALYLYTGCVASVWDQLSTGARICFLSLRVCVFQMCTQAPWHPCGISRVLKRGSVSYRYVCVYLKCVHRLRGIRVGSVEYCSEQLELGQLSGNRFQILMRDVQPLISEDSQDQSHSKETNGNHSVDDLESQVCP